MKDEQYIDEFFVRALKKLIHGEARAEFYLDLLLQLCNFITNGHSEQEIRAFAISIQENLE